MPLVQIPFMEWLSTKYLKEHFIFAGDLIEFRTMQLENELSS